VTIKITTGTIYIWTSNNRIRFSSGYFTYFRPLVNLSNPIMFHFILHRRSGSSTPVVSDYIVIIPVLLLSSSVFIYFLLQNIFAYQQLFWCVLYFLFTL